MKQDHPVNSSPLPPSPPLTPMLAQYLEVKSKYKDAILFYRMGDFYEMFFDDATTAAPVLEVQLTSRDRSAASPIPMCGVPYHAVTQYLQKLLAKGFKVAICEQLEDPAATKGLVRRDVVRVVTPALIGDPDLVPEESRNLLASLVEGEPFAEIALLDLLAGEVRSGVVSSFEGLMDLFSQRAPKEVLVSEKTAQLEWFGELRKQFPQLTVSIRTAYFSTTKKKSNRTVNALLQYLKETQKRDELPYLSSPLPLFENQAMTLDGTTANALEVIRANSGPDGPTLFSVLDLTATPMGRRLLKEWLLSPLGKLKTIQARHEAVQELLENSPITESLRELIQSVRDLERLTTKTALGLAMPRDLVSIRDVLNKLPELKTRLGKCRAALLRQLFSDLDVLPKLTAKLEAALEDIAPATLRDGGIFKDDFNAEIAEYRRLSRDAKSTIAAIETREKNKTGISSLKIKYSKVFGYTFEITRSHLSKVPKEYIRKQTIANGERFITEELKEFEEKVITAEHRLKTLEEKLFFELRHEVGESANALLKNALSIATLDILIAFARAARERNYVRPTMKKSGALNITDGRHPVVERLLPTGQFVPNSISLSDEECRTLIITGPNMGGKSTIMRQVALIILMAHAGSFIPAASARIPLTDSIYTRIGSADDLARGRSTFMVEMTEVARILERATPRSLIIIDEIGRGTSTYDGLALAWSLLEFIHTSVRAKTLFATHFHELTLLEKSIPGLSNANVLVKKWKDAIVFLYKLAPGICNQSYGIEVAKLAGLPRKVLIRARDIQGILETQSQRGTRTRNRALEIHDNQMAFFDAPKAPETLPGLET